MTIPGPPPPKSNAHPRARRVVLLAAAGAIVGAGAAFALAGSSGPASATSSTPATAATTAPGPAGPASPDWSGPGSWRAAGAGDYRDAAGKIIASDRSSITIATGDGTTVVIPTAASTTYLRLAKVADSAVTAGGHIVAFGDPAGQGVLDASTAVAGPVVPDGWQVPGQADGTWSQWGVAAGTVESVTGSTVTVTPDDVGTFTTIRLGPAATVLSATEVTGVAVAAGDHAIVALGNGARSTASQVIFTDQSLPLPWSGCWPFLP